MRHRVVVDRDEVVGLQQVVGHVGRLEVRAVLEQVLADDVAEGPHALDRRAQVLVDVDEAIAVELDPGIGCRQRVRVGFATGGHEHGVDPKLGRIATGRVELEHRLGTVRGAPARSRSRAGDRTAARRPR